MELLIQGVAHFDRTRKLADRMLGEHLLYRCTDVFFAVVKHNLLSGKFFRLRWLETVSSTFQDVAFDGSLLPLFIS